MCESSQKLKPEIKSKNNTNQRAIPKVKSIKYTDLLTVSIILRLLRNLQIQQEALCPQNNYPACIDRAINRIR